MDEDWYCILDNLSQVVQAFNDLDACVSAEQSEQPQQVEEPQQPQQPQQNRQQYGVQEGGNRATIVSPNDGAVPSTSREQTLPPSDRQKQHPVQEGGSRAVIVSPNDGAVPSTSREQTSHSTDRQKQHSSGKGFTIVSALSTRNAKFKYARRNHTLLLDNVPSGVDPLEWLKCTFSNILASITQDLKISPFDKVSFEIVSEGSPEKPVHFSFRIFNQIDADVILNAVEKVVQSNADFFSSGPLTVTLSHIEMPHGAGRNVAAKYVSDQDYVGAKRKIIAINNDDKLCLVRALAVSISLSDGTPKQQRDNLIRRKKTLTNKAKQLCIQAGVDLTNGAGIDEIRQFQEYLTDHQITVFTDRRGHDVIFQGPFSTSDHPRKNIDIFHHDEHYDVITSVLAAFDTAYYCRPCRVRYANIGSHKCPDMCSQCRKSTKCSEDLPRVKCKTCLRTFNGQTCFENHKGSTYSNNRSVCDVHKICDKCCKYVNLRDRIKHTCGEIYCELCKKYCPANHACYMQKFKPKKQKKDANTMYVFYDIEATQCTTINGKPHLLEHVPNLLVSQQCCLKCMDKPLDAVCSACSPGETKENIFQGPKPVEEFLCHVRKRRPQIHDVVAIAHNMKGYDGHFILQHLIQDLKWAPDIIKVGSKIMSISCNDIAFKDSLNFIPMALKDFPKTFNLQTGLKKGFFPHYFNRPDNFQYVGQVPDKKFYGADEMNAKDRNEFLNWHANQIQQKSVFNFHKELVDYCKDDVTILRSSCVSFRNEFLNQNQLDPFWNAVTIAGACMKVYRQNFLKENMIGLLPPGGYRCADRQSFSALCWLRWEAHRRNIEIVTANNGREIKIVGKKVDGYHQETSTIYEYHGCYFHGCIKCYPEQGTVINQATNETMGNRREATIFKTELLRAAGHNVIEMWECQFNFEKQVKVDLAEFLSKHPRRHDTPLNPRDAFFGGRTNCTKVYYKCKAGEVIKYFDVCSLYPWVNKYGRYPIGHPKIYFGKQKCSEFVGNDLNDLSNVEGIIKCTVTPPSDLYHPVLPQKMNGKLMFVLCNQCGLNSIQTECLHNSVTQKELTGTWVTEEVKKAIEHGYVVTAIHEIWQYDTEQYDPRTMSGGLFLQYVNTFLKLKTEASGWPKWCITEKHKQRYLDEFHAREGVKLDPSKIAYNPGKRSQAKLMLNSFWGKFGQRNDLTKHKIIDSYAEEVELLSNPRNEVISCELIGEDKMLVTWKENSNDETPSPLTNVVIAAYTTTLARLKLYSYLEMLGERVLYYDTDSVIFVSRTGDVDPPCGDYLGDMTDELQEYGEGSYISEFISGGPKNYSYKVACGGNIATSKTVCKVRGLRLNYSASSKVNFDSMKDITLNDGAPINVYTPHKIVRVRHFKIATREENKIYRTVVTKRRMIENHDTIPYGYKRQRR